MPDDLKHQSKYLSLVLRHDPGSIGLVLDTAGWTDIDDLIARATIPFTRDMILGISAASDKQRFAISPDGMRIRANQGHSIAVDLQLVATAPPAQLYHGTASRFLEPILQDGLTRQSRHHVHLSADTETARKVGQRHGAPAVLRVDSAAMFAAGHVFFRAENGVWLTDSVPPAFLAVTDS